jgi:hypothetical protein
MTITAGSRPKDPTNPDTDDQDTDNRHTDNRHTDDRHTDDHPAWTLANIPTTIAELRARSGFTNQLVDDDLPPF